MIRNLPAIRAYVRKAHLMILRCAETPIDRTSTKLGGVPYLTETDRWPICQACHQPMTFMFQANLSDIPPGDFRIGRHDFLSFYYCLNCQPHGSHEDAGYHIELRQLERAAELQTSSFAMHDPDRPEPKECAVVFRSIDDLPPPEKIVCILGAEDEAIEEYEQHVEQVRGGRLEASKIGGYAYWLQTQPTVRCSCGATMRFLGQIHSNPKFDLLWANNGVLYLLYCPEACTPNSVAFVIQS